MNALQHVHDDFDGYGTSAMKSVIEQKILKGRPYGGTGFIWNKKFSKCIKPRLDFKHERVTVLEITDSSYGILCINVYLPYFKSSKIAEHLAIYNETIGFVENIMNCSPGYKFVLLGDFNCNIYNPRHPYTSIVRDLMLSRNLICTFDLLDGFDPDVHYTRTNTGPGANNGSLLDYVIISKELKDSVSGITINHLPDNLSDHFPVSVDFELSLTDIITKKRDYLPASVNWSNINEDVRQLYENTMKEHLDSIIIPFNCLLHGNHLCNSNEHIFCIENYFCDIIRAIIAADQCLPRSRPGLSKSYWTDDLTNLKRASYDAFSMWHDAGRPSSGVVYDLKRSTSCRYKYEVKKAKKLFDQGRSNALHNELANNNGTKFWKAWKGLHGKQDDGAVRINGKIDDTDIANEFAASFKRIYDEASSDQARQLTREFHTLYDDYTAAHVLDDISTNYLSWDNMVTVIARLQPGKSSGSSIKAEHILNGCPQLTIHLHLLFNSMIQHSYVPSEFLRGVITPIIKDAEGDASSLDNYRGITLSHVFSYLFDHAVLLKIDSFLITDDLQFGYKKKHSTSHAVYSVKRCIDYFSEHGSNVYASFLDCTKGFDRVSHSGLFLKLIKRGVPLCWIRIFVYWYSNMFSVCKWKNGLSSTFSVISGVRQGGVLSAKFWAVYMDNLVKELRETGKGCHMVDLFIACILYADDVCLLAPSRRSLQLLLDICSKYAFTWCIKYNERKTKLMYFGGNFESFSCSPIVLNDVPLDFVPKWKYLGVMLKSDKRFSCSAEKPRNAFYRSSNSILNVLNGPSNDVQMKLLYSICVPIITYACDVVVYNHNELQSLHVALNDAIRKIFSYNRWESIKTLRESRGYLSVTQIFATRKLSFESLLPEIGNATLSTLSSI